MSEYSLFVIAATPATARSDENIWSPARIPEAANCEATVAAASKLYAVPSTESDTFFITSATACSSLSKPNNWKWAFSRLNALFLPPVRIPPVTKPAAFFVKFIRESVTFWITLIPTIPNVENLFWSDSTPVEILAREKAFATLCNSSMPAAAPFRLEAFFKSFNELIVVLTRLSNCELSNCILTTRSSMLLMLFSPHSMHLPRFDQI